MSYCRWSTVVLPEDVKLSFDDHLKLYLTKNPEEIAKMFNGFVSDWYIFWHSCSGETIDTQYLAVWNCNNDTHPMFNYHEIFSMVKTKNFAPLGTVTQAEFLLECLNDWLEEVEEEFPIGETNNE